MMEPLRPVPSPEVQLLIDLYDPLDPDRSDLEAYLAMVEEFGAQRVLDLGCGTGVLALLLAERGKSVVGLDPSIESLIVARRTDGPDRIISIYGEERTVPRLADKVTWVHGYSTDIPDDRFDLVVCTGNAMQQIFVEDDVWAATLAAVNRALAPGGHFIFETRIPAVRAWEAWNPTDTRRSANIPGYGSITGWTEVVEVTESPITDTHRATLQFHESGISIVSGPEKLRFREQDEIRAALDSAGFDIVDIRDAPDRPDREWVFVATKRD